MKKTESRNIQRRVERKPKRQIKGLSEHGKMELLPTEAVPTNHRAEHLAKCKVRRERRAKRKAEQRGMA